MSAFMQPEAEYLSPEEAREYEAGDESGWYGRLSASGYLDCTDWTGPYDRAWKALRAVCDMYDVDVDGDERGKS